MLVQSLGAEALIDQAEAFKTFLGLNPPMPKDRLFLVTGLTGAGKSTFISNCTGRSAVIGHGLYSCTNSVEVFQYNRSGRRIFLIDTPGFNDTTRSDIDTLEILATYLGTSYANGVRIHGVIILHPISNNRMAGSSLRSLSILKAIVGSFLYNNVAIVTTMWPESPALAENKVFEEREVELAANKDFFGELVTKGASLFRYRDAVDSQVESAQRIIGYLLHQLDKHEPVGLQLQRDIVDEKKNLGETSAGITVSEYLHNTDQKHQTRLIKLQTEIDRTSSELDKSYSLQLQDLKAEVDKDIHETARGRQALTQTLADLHRTETKALTQRVMDLQRKFEAEAQTKEIILQDVKESCDALQKEVARLTSQPQQQQLVARRTKTHQKALVKAQKDAEKTRRDRQKVQEYTKEIVGGLMNGLAAGAVAGVMGGALCIVM